MKRYVVHLKDSGEGKVIIEAESYSITKNFKETTFSGEIIVFSPGETFFKLSDVIGVKENTSANAPRID